MNKLDPKKSLCYACKYGLCHSIEQAAQIGATPNEDGEMDFAGENNFEEMPSYIEGKTILSFCFWRPAGMVTDQATSLTAGVINECSRYEKE